MRGMRGRMIVVSFSALLVMSASSSLLLLACPNGSDPPIEDAPFCVDASAVPEAGACEASVEPTYEALYANTFQPTCAKSGSSCHSSVGKQGGIDFSDKEKAFAALSQNNVARPREPECSKIVQRVIATDGRIRMPPGANIPAGEQCAITQWVQNGAQR
jgi:hypothetical protein